MSTAYPITMKDCGKEIVVFVPDFNINTQGRGYADAMAMAREAICLMAVDMQDDGEAVPAPSRLADVRPEDGWNAALVDVDFDDFRRKNDLRTVKKNCTVPAWLAYEAERAGVNFSAALQNALKQELGVSHP